MVTYRKDIILGQAEYTCEYRYYPDVNLDDEHDNEHVELIHVYCGGYNHIENLSKEALEDLEDRCLLSHHR